MLSISVLAASYRLFSSSKEDVKSADAVELPGLECFSITGLAELPPDPDAAIAQIEGVGEVGSGTGGFAGGGTTTVSPFVAPANASGSDAEVDIGLIGDGLTSVEPASRRRFRSRGRARDLFV